MGHPHLKDPFKLNDDEIEDDNDNKHYYTVNHPDVNELYTRNGKRVECMQAATIKRIFELWKSNSNKLTLIMDILGCKEAQNGERDKQILDAETRIKEVGKRTEEEDNNIKVEVREMHDDINNLNLTVGKLETKVDILIDKKKTKWGFQEKIIIGVLTAIFGPLIVLLLLFLVKTFIWQF